ncbi:RRXRR domain-containing protein [Scytonema sp. PCC 10023]|uniref:RRXRR domain-containing protein n=1 Tax=Scytonema sp. PCC 10023 TaxID=1680591 RepID=UPI0039C6A06E
MFVPVVDSNNRPLMPTTPSRARRWIKSGKATPFFKKGVFCVRLNVEPSSGNYQPVAVGVDPGSKREGFTVKSKCHTYLNVQTHAVDWVKDHIEVRRNMRRARRFRNTPCRQNRVNRLVNTRRIPPSTLARWQWKLRVCKWLTLMFPVTTFVVEDIKAKTWKNARKWNVIFSPLEVGKRWFYSELQQIGRLETRTGNDTYEMRQRLGLKKSKNKLSSKFDAHCVDSWVLANWCVGGHVSPDNTSLIDVVPLQFHRRQLHRLQHQKGGIRPRYGGTMSAGFKRGSVVKHPKYGFTYVSGWQESPTKKDPNRKTISLHALHSGKRLTQNAIPTDCKFLTYNSWRVVKSSDGRRQHPLIFPPVPKRQRVSKSIARFYDGKSQDTGH